MKPFIWLFVALLISTAQAAYIPTYDIVSFMPGVPSNGAIIRFVLIRKVKLAAGLSGATCLAKTAATSTTTVALHKVSGGITTSIGTLVWSASGTSCAVTFASEVNFAIGDAIEEAFPGTADATLADIAISLPGIRLQ